MENPTEKNRYLAIAESEPASLLDGATPRLIDEWQTAPILWDAVRFEVDMRNAKGQFILTGSRVPDNAKIMHSGTGRFSRMMMRPMSLFESLDSNGAISLKGLFTDDFKVGVSSDMTLEKLAFLIARGGWPASVGVNEKTAIAVGRDYLESVVKIDMSDVDGVKRDPEKVRRLLESLARNICSTVATSTITADIASSGTMARKTTESYIEALKKIFIIDDVPAWSPYMRSRTRLREAPKRNLVDPSIAAAALKTAPKGIIGDFKTFGLLFESLCMRDLRVYAESLYGTVYHYRDETGLEVDAIIDLGNGEWGAVEVKLGGEGPIDIAAKNLLRLKNKIDEEIQREPAFLMMLTGTGFTFRREDGVYVVPIGCLRN